MKSLSSKLFQDSELDSKIEMSKIVGGMPVNRSDQQGGYTDSKYGGSWDKIVESLKDVYDSNENVDKPLEEIKFENERLVELT